VTASRANFEQRTCNACQDHAGGKHRFSVALLFGMGRQAGSTVHGIRVVNTSPTRRLRVASAVAAFR